MGERAFRVAVVFLLSVIAFFEVFAITKKNYPTYGEWRTAEHRKEVTDRMPVVRIIGGVDVSGSSVEVSGGSVGVYSDN